MAEDDAVAAQLKKLETDVAKLAGVIEQFAHLFHRLDAAGILPGSATVATRAIELARGIRGPLAP